MKKFIPLIFLSFFLQFSFAQNFSIKGTVKDVEGNPLIGANVILMETNFGAATDLNGRYNINNLKPGRYTVEFSMVGFERRTFPNIIINNSSVEVDALLQQKVIESEQVIITAGKYEQKKRELTVSADVIPADELDKKNYTNLKDALQFVPGVNMVEDQVSIRGSSGYSRGAGTRVLVAIDGIPFYTGDTGEIIWEILPVNEIQKVEVIKGAASSLYGSSALGGVINIITKGISQQPQTYVKLLGGAYDKPAYSQWEWTNSLRAFNSQTISHSNRINKLGFTISLTRIANSGYKFNGDYNRFIGYFKGIYNFSPTSSLTLFANTLNQRSGYFIYWKDSRNALVPPDGDRNREVKANRYMGGLLFKNVLADNLLLNVRSSYYRTNWNDQSTSENISTADLFRTEIQTNYDFSDNLILVSGIEGTAAKVNSNIFGNPSAFGFGIYSQADFKFSFPLKISGGFRYDFSKLDSLKAAGAFSPKIGLNYQVNQKLSFRANIGAGFRAPSLAEAFTSTTASGLTVKPNPNLKPESNISAEVGINYQPDKIFQFDAALFQNEFYDFIEPGIDPKDGKAFFENVTRARIQGFEVNTNYNLFSDKLILSLNYTYLWARDIQTNTPLKYRPRHQATAGLSYNFSNFEIGSSFRYASKVEKMDFELADLGIIKDGRNYADVYLLDLNASFNLLPAGFPAKLNFNANNVLNYNYVELIANLAPIRNYSLSVEFLL